jgi:hypothetical protein
MDMEGEDIGHGGVRNREGEEVKVKRKKGTRVRRAAET